MSSRKINAEEELFTRITLDRGEMNEYVLKRVNCDRRLLNTVYACQLTFIHHTLKHNSFERTWIGMTLGRQVRERPETRRSDHG